MLRYIAKPTAGCETVNTAVGEGSTRLADQANQQPTIDPSSGDNAGTKGGSVAGGESSRSGSGFDSVLGRALVERGTHVALIAQGGRYAELVARDSLGVTADL
jgi:hypothetical protein